MSAATISVDEFLALEQKVLQTVELIKKEREARAAAESEAAGLRAELASTQEKLAAAEEKLNVAGAAQAEIDSLHREREAVKTRVEAMLAKMDELL